MRNRRCGDCGVKEGQFHYFGCDMEQCPFCGGQLLGDYDCACRQLGLLDHEEYTEATQHMSPEVYYSGLSEEQWGQWYDILEAKGRIPHIQYPVICARCGKLWPDFFEVSNAEWEHYISPQQRGKVICWECYQQIKHAIDTAPGLLEWPDHLAELRAEEKAK